MVIAAFGLVGCGGGGTPSGDVDGGRPDALRGDKGISADPDGPRPDTSGVDPDGSGGGETTQCGSETCDRATEVCAYHSSRSAMYYACAPLPQGCDQDRGCGCVGTAACGGEYCAETGSDNFVMCRMSPSMSCPFLYLYDEQSGSYRYHTDLAGSVLGAGLKVLAPQHYAGAIYALGDYATASDSYRMKVRETIYEADFFDAAQLILVDVPAGYQVFNEWSFTSQLGHRSPTRFFSVKDPRQPISATDDAGRDVLAAVRDRDGVPLPVRYAGRSRVVVDFGPIARPEQAKLIITAWSFYHDLAAYQRPPFSAGTTIETLDASGRWVVRKVAGKNPGDSRTWVIELAGVLRADDTRMRITMAHQPTGLDILDQLLLDDSEPVALHPRAVAPRSAVLQFGGAARYTYATPTGRITSDDVRLPLLDDALLAGDYTRYGDVRPLLDAVDDRFVIMAHGDELLLTFDRPPQAPDTKRWAFLFADVFYSIKYSVHGVLTRSIEPLPFHGMTSYPYLPREWPYLRDAAYARYRRAWNTRRVEAP